MLEVYKDCLEHIWKWTKQFMLGVAVLLPGIIFLIYMFASNMPDVGWVPSLLVIAAIVLWSPVPLKPVFFKDKTLVECYLDLMEGLGVTILVCIIFVGWPPHHRGNDILHIDGSRTGEVGDYLYWHCQRCLGSRRPLPVHQGAQQGVPGLAWLPCVSPNATFVKKRTQYATRIQGCAALRRHV